MSRRALVGLGLLVAVVAGIIVLLASGGPGGSDGADSAEPAELTNDVVIAEGPEPPTDTALADVIETSVARHGSRFVFRAEMAARIPARVKGGAMSWRWDIYDAGVGTWILSANLDIGPTASLTSTQSNYGSSTFDKTFPGSMRIEGDTLVITLNPDELDDWPDEFEWVLGTSLDGAQGNARSALATDTSPDEGRGTVRV